MNVFGNPATTGTRRRERSGCIENVQSTRRGRRNFLDTPNAENVVIRSWLAGPTALLVGVSTVSLHAQEPAGATPAPVATIQRLFDAMNAADTATARRVFIPVGRIVPLRADGALVPLSVDQFTAYVATIPAGSWHERIWEPRTELFGGLAHVWFEYDVVRADTVRQCGRQSVQLTQSGDGWRILSMAFAPSTVPCTRVVSLNSTTPLTVTNGRVIATSYRGRSPLKLVESRRGRRFASNALKHGTSRGLVTTSAGAQTTAWPAARARHHLTYDPTTQRVLLE